MLGLNVFILVAWLGHCCCHLAVATAAAAALWGICSLFVALINILRTKQHLKVLFLELSI